MLLGFAIVPFGTLRTFPCTLFANYVTLLREASKKVRRGH